MDIWVALILIVFGLIFLVLEIFVFPGVGFSGVIGFISVVAGIVIAFRIDTYLGLTFLAGSSVGTSVLIYYSIKMDTFSMMSLKRNIKSKVNVNHLTDLKIGDEGVTISRLAPMGKAEINNYIVEVASHEGFIDQNVVIRITQINDNTIFVSPIKK